MATRRALRACRRTTFKTAGPRLAITDRGLTFATNGERGVRIDFRTPVPGLDPLRLHTPS